MISDRSVEAGPHLHQDISSFIGVSRWSRPSLWGRGRGRGHYLIGVSRWLRPSLRGRGRGRGHYLIGVSRWSRPSLRGRGRGRGQFFSACSPCSQKGFCSSVKICKRENFQRAPCVLFSQKNTEEQNTQRRTETLSQPITQSVTANISYKVCAICRLPADVCGFSLFAERLLFICENLWEIEFPMSYHKKTCPMTPTMVTGARNEN